MLKKDPIFWGATGIFVLAIVIFAVTQNQLWLTLMIGSYLLRPTLASLGVAKRFVDERQLSIHYRSSNIAFVVMLITCIIFIAKLSAEDNHDWEMFNMVIMIGLATKGLLNVVLAKNLREGASKIIIAAGLLITLFVSMESVSGGLSLGALIHMAPGLSVLAIGLLSKKYPREIGVLVFVVTIALEFIILGKGFTWGQVGTAVIIGIPLLTAGFCLYARDKNEIEIEPAKSE